MSYGWTLDHNNTSSLNYDAPNLQHGSIFSDGWQMKLPHGSMDKMRQASKVADAAVYNIWQDVYAPGVREQILNPTFQTGPFRSSIYDRRRQNNQAPIPLNYGDPSIVPQVNDQNRRTGAAYFEWLNGNYLDVIPGWVERGTFSVPYTGVSAIANFKPHTTMRYQ